MSTFNLEEINERMKRKTGSLILETCDKALVFNKSGEVSIEEGPQRLFLWRQKYQRLIPKIADQNEYVKIIYKSGKTEHMPGPCVVFSNPLEHFEIEKNASISLDANEALVIYRMDNENKKVTRYIQHGPARFIPAANEWLHNFSWHGTVSGDTKNDPYSRTNKTQMLKGANKFTKLRVVPDQFYYNVDEVRTADDALIRVKLMMFYELVDIEKMLNETSDPMADFINCLCADVVAFASRLIYMEFIEKSGELNYLKNYPQLTERCEAIGYKVSKVVFRGYYAAPKLQAILDDSIALRTHIKLDYEKEQQLQQFTDLSLHSQMEQLAVEQQMELDKLHHNQEIENSKKKKVPTATLR